MLLRHPDTKNATSSSISFSRDGTHRKLCDEDVDDATDDCSEIEHVPRIMEVVLKKESQMWPHPKALSWTGGAESVCCVTQSVLQVQVHCYVKNTQHLTTAYLGFFKQTALLVLPARRSSTTPTKQKTNQKKHQPATESTLYLRQNTPWTLDSKTSPLIKITNLLLKQITTNLPLDSNQSLICFCPFLISEG